MEVNNKKGNSNIKRVISRLNWWEWMWLARLRKKAWENSKGREEKRRNGTVFKLGFSIENLLYFEVILMQIFEIYLSQPLSKWMGEYFISLFIFKSLSWSNSKSDIQSENKH